MLGVKADLYARRAFSSSAEGPFRALAAVARETAGECLVRVGEAVPENVRGVDAAMLALSATAFFASDRPDAMLAESRADLDRIVAQLHGDERRAADVDRDACEFFQHLRGRYESVRVALEATSRDGVARA